MSDETKAEFTPRCSWCHKPQDDVAILIASPTELPRAYICDECVAVCNWIIVEHRQKKAKDKPV
jgi:ATP-dependent Clp protease ATP-binding subunit ClpX